MAKIIPLFFLFFICGDLLAQGTFYFYPYFKSSPNIPKEFIRAKNSAIMRKSSECKRVFMDTICKDTQNSTGQKEKIISIYQCCARRKDTLKTIFASIHHFQDGQDTTFYNLNSNPTLSIYQNKRSRNVEVYLYQYDTVLLGLSQTVDDGAMFVERRNYSDYTILPKNKLQLIDTLAWKGNICSIAHYHPNGQLSYKGQYSNQFNMDSFPIPIRIGRWEYYHENGGLDTIYNYDKPKRSVRIVPHKRH